MKFAVLAFAALVSTSALADQKVSLGLDKFADESFLITDPVHKGSNLPIVATAENDETGVCRYLGYERYAAGSARWAKDSKLTVWLDAGGQAVKAAATRAVKSIICVNEILTFVPPQESALIEGAILHGSSGVALSAQTDDQLQGACYYIGFAKYLGGAKFASRNEQVILLGADATVVGAPSGRKITRLVCLK